ncbi:MAG: patatin-like phospholipase family protein [Chloroflexi bacterium]|nr:MAG: patatin-like phospholipase family protein [Chloroflexota bacterium]TMD74592.1 MAG: patatin-like phospholipase family protein [Chloroflexota bacterium]
MIRPSPRHVQGGGNRRVAFVLSGGGSLGAVQIGMLRALFENGIRPDFLVGTSVGAVNASWIAGRPDHDGTLELQDIWLGLRRQDVFPISPLTSAAGLLGRSNHFISNESLRRVLEKHVPFERIEEASLPLHVVATDLKSGRAAVLASGPAIPALLASCAIPGVFPPVTIGRREYVDGGVANHTPITVAIELGADEIYVLPVGYPWLNREPTNALGMALHALARIVEQKLDAEVAAHRDSTSIHVMPALDLADVSPADFSRTRELIDWGYRSAKRALSAGNGRTVLPEKAKKTLRLSPAEAA